MGVKLSGMKLGTMATAIGKRFIDRIDLTRRLNSVHTKDSKIGACRKWDILHCFGADSLVNIWAGKGLPGSGGSGFFFAVFTPRKSNSRRDCIRPEGHSLLLTKNSCKRKPARFGFFAGFLSFPQGKYPVG
ncbi:hypothetical protein [Flavisolibacter nicotianae]|uniref:hypothetical protein n=1 Tax=Flavisolibacter nicotianae TaxID=2364882 RepID=UPI000EAC6101|nr:hypothetical protein [Flavisolibacter nicotianae]